MILKIVSIIILIHNKSLRYKYLFCTLLFDDIIRVWDTSNYYRDILLDKKLYKEKY